MNLCMITSRGSEAALFVARWRGRGRGPGSGNDNGLGRLGRDGAGQGGRCMEWEGMVQEASGRCAGMTQGPNALFVARTDAIRLSVHSRLRSPRVDVPMAYKSY